MRMKKSRKFIIKPHQGASISCVTAWGSAESRRLFVTTEIWLELIKMKFICNQDPSRHLRTIPPKHFLERKRATRNEKFSFWKTLLAAVIFKLDLGDGSISWPQAHRLDQSPSQLTAYSKLPIKIFSREKCLKEKLWKIRWKLYFKDHAKNSI